MVHIPMEVCKTHALHFGKIMSCLQLKRMKNTRFIFLNDPIDEKALMYTIMFRRFGIFYDNKSKLFELA